MLNIIIAVVITFIVVSLWHLIASAKLRGTQRFMVEMLLKELDDMANELRHNDFESYLKKKKVKSMRKRQCRISQTFTNHLLLVE